MNARTAILVIDDNAQNRALARATLEDEGFRVTEAHDGVTGIAAFQRDRPACIVMDVRMPGMDGLGACARIRGLPGGVAVAIVFATADRELETFDRALAAGGDDFLTKPLRPDELIARVRAAMHVRQLAGERSALAVQLKQQHVRLQRLALQKEQLATFLVHDLKNPVASIDLQAQRVLREPGASARAVSAATAIRAETRRLMRMITNLLDVARADEGQLAPACVDVDLGALVELVFDELRPLAAVGHVELVASVQATRLHADQDLVHRVLTNLVENAVRHSEEHTAVRVNIVDVADGTELHVRDEGAGIPEERRHAIFDRFATGAPTNGHHRGLGLTFCKLAVEAHGGTIWVADGEPGALFCVRFPRHPS